MVEANEIDILPPEMIEKVLKYLSYKHICQNLLVCKKWHKIIIKGNLLKKASCKFQMLYCNCMNYFILIVFIFSKDFLYDFDWRFFR